MFRIREARLDDAPTLLKLAKMVHFINLPADADIIATKIRRSRRSFAGEADEREREFMFVLVDDGTDNVVGTSLIVSHISWHGHPNVYFRVRKREHYSEDLATGAVHVTLQLCTDESGPTEIGGLILSPSYRNHREKLGSFLSLVRFHFIGLHREWFADRIMAEMMAPLTPDSRNTLWEYLGRRFINLSYTEADRFCQYSKEFMTSLLPKTEMYVSLLPPEARNLIGKVGLETEPAKRMLEKLGFSYKGQIDPFDGGPYLEAMVDELDLVRATRRLPLQIESGELPDLAFLSAEDDGRFHVVRAACRISDDAVNLGSETAAALDVQAGAAIGVTPMPNRASQQPAAREEAAS